MNRLTRSAPSQVFRLVVCLMIAWGAEATLAGDWPQILGPSRNGISQGEQLLGKLPDDGLKILWQYEVGEGYAGPAVVGPRVIMYHRVGRSEHVDCLDLATGKRLWQTKLATEYQPGINPDAGPRCVPVITDGRVVVFSPGGRLSCLELESGKSLWERKLYEDYAGDENYFGAGSTPVVLAGKILVNVGGRRDAGIVAVELSTGKTAWTATRAGTSYAAPTALEFKGQPIALFVTRLSAIGIAPADGKVLFEYPFGKRGATVNAAVPLVTPQGVFLSASYGVGARMLTPASPEPTVVWSNTDSLSSQYFTSVYHEGFLYGIDGREDFQDTALRCVSAETGKVVWTESQVPGAHLILVGDQILLVDIEGGVRVFDATSSGYQLKYEARLLESPGRSLPALSQGLLLARTNASGGTGLLRCAVVGKRPE